MLQANGVCLKKDKTQHTIVAMAETYCSNQCIINVVVGVLRVLRIRWLVTAARPGSKMDKKA